MTIAIIGWCGTILYLLNHAYISLDKQWRKSIYYSANAAAAICLIISSTINSSWQAVVINAFWAIISLSLLLNFNLASIKFSKRLFNLVVIVMLAVFVGQLVFYSQANLTLLGWTSAFVFSACYLLFSAEKMLPRYYLCWNAFAAIALLPQLWLDQNWPVFTLEIVWALISIYGAAKRFEEIHLVQ